MMQVHHISPPPHWDVHTTGTITIGHYFEVHYVGTKPTQYPEHACVAHLRDHRMSGAGAEYQVRWQNGEADRWVHEIVVKSKKSVSRQLDCNDLFVCDTISLNVYFVLHSSMLLQ
jgi:hypothetical protein